MTASAFDAQMVFVLDQGERALRHSEEVWPYNEAAMYDERTSEAVRQAVEKGSLLGGDQGFPAVRVIYPCGQLDPTQAPIWSAQVVNTREEWLNSELGDPAWRGVSMHRAISGWCGRCAASKQTAALLYVPAGMSIVAVEMCVDCCSYMSKNVRPLLWTA